jgi:hypothetical protein
MIVRVLRAKVRAGRVGPFNAVFRRQLALLREQPGLAYVKLARRLNADGGQDAVLFEEWSDADSLYAWIGPNLAIPRLVPGARELIDELVVAHYEVLDEDADEVAVAGGKSGRERETAPEAAT